jgi:DNA-binding beta-propeller fold protein YncE
MADRTNHPADLLDRYVAALRTDRRSPAPEPLDPELAQIARTIEQVADETRPDSGAIERVWRAIDAANGQSDQPREWAAPPQRPSPNGHIRLAEELVETPTAPPPDTEPFVPPLIRPRRRSRIVLQLVAEVLLLIAGAGLLVLLFRGGSDQQAGNTPAKATAQALIDQRVVADWQQDGGALDGSVLAGLGIAPDGTLYVADYANSRILHLRADGTLIAPFGGAGSSTSQLLLNTGNLVSSIGVDSAGNVYVPDYGNGRVQIFAPDGSLLTTWDARDGLLGLPSAVAVGPDDTIFVAEFSMSENRWRVLTFDHDGNHLLTIGTDAIGTNQLEHLAGIAVDGAGNLYACDVGNNRILKFDSDGNFLLDWGGSGTEPGRFNEPGSVAVDRQGVVYVADVFNFRVQRFDSTGQYLGEWDTTAKPTDTLDRPFSVAVGDDGAIYVVDHSNALHRYRLDAP